MIYVFTEHGDVSIDYVLDYFIQAKKEFYRINDDDNLEFISFEMDPFSVYFKHKGSILNIQEHSEILIRRASNLRFSNAFDDKLPQYVRFHLSNELFALEYFIKQRISNIAKFGEFIDNSRFNKLNVLKIAHELGLKIPITAVHTTKDSIVRAIEENSSIITKAITNGFATDLKSQVSYLTNTIERNHLDSFDYTFFPSLIQNHIKKAGDIRVFIFNENIFSSLILSQENEQTSVDFRNYDWDNPNRILPIELPNEIKSKLLLLMKELNLTTGSADLILTEGGEYVFLEMNPEGQFEQVSKPCGYNIEWQIAQLYL